LGSAGRFIDIATSLPPGKPNPNAPMTLGNLLMKQFQEANPVFDMPTTMSHIMIRDIKLNCDGTRVAILADYVEGSLEVHHHDTRLHIYDRNKGTYHLHARTSPPEIGFAIFDCNCYALSVFLFVITTAFVEDVTYIHSIYRSQEESMCMTLVSHDVVR
jgi:hypothetical protein